ncbi:MAG: F0F1 ATP synthase subunit delta [Acidimicrobiales bacterium]
MNPALEGYVAAVLGSVPASERAALADDLAAVGRILAANRDLGAAMTDVAVPAAARRAVLSDVLDGKVSIAARRTAAFAAGAVRAQEVPGAVAWAAHRARQVADGRPVPEDILGHRQARDRVGGFATAVFEDLPTADLDEVEDELFRFARTVGGTPALRAALGDRDLPVPAREAVVGDLLGGKVGPATLRLVGYAVAGGRPRDIVGTLEWLVERTAEARGWRVARVRAGQEVDAGERRQLEETLSRLAGWPVELQVTLEPALLAGVNVEIGDLRVDATARGRLERLREHVAAGGWHEGERPPGREEHGQGAGGPAGDGPKGAQ